MSRSGEGLPVEVVAYAGGRGEEEPRSVRIGGERRAVEEVLGRWAEPNGRFFRVATDDGHVHVLVHDEARDEWRLVVGAGRPRRSGRSAP